MNTKQTPPRDPFFERESEKYQDPIPSREYIMSIIDASEKGLTRSDLEELLDLVSEEHREALRRRLRAMTRDGQLLRNRRGQYRLMAALDLISGVVLGHREGHGFLKPDAGGDDVFLSPREMRHVFPGDKVAVCEIGRDRRGRREGKIIEILRRNTTQVVGRLHEDEGVWFLTPDNSKICKEILITGERAATAKPGQIVVAEITNQPGAYHLPTGVITEVLGDHMAPGLEIEIALRSYDLPHQWPEGVLAQAKSFNAKQAPDMTADRKDLRHLNFVTIDGEDAKDFDDAVYCESRMLGGYTLYVAIADVSAYVTPGSALDQEARTRGNSVYFPSAVIPMLPEVLSNGLCSLVPHVDRYCMVCEMQIGRSGKLLNYKFYPAMMHSKARITYKETYGILTETDKKAATKFSHVQADLKRLYALYQVLHQARAKRGAIDFDLPETRIIFGNKRKIKRILPLVRNDAHRLIEECMLMANVATAKFLLKHYKAALFRNHDTPSPDKLADTRAFLHELNLSLGGRDNPDPKHYTKLLNSIGDRPDKHLIQTVLLRSMMQAQYEAKNSGHFGLAYEAYTHFTSPIRRYPDLIVHRLIRGALNKKSAPSYDEEALSDIAANSSMTERRADEATRDVEAWLKCEFMQDKVGETFSGVISSVTGFGLFIELDQIYIEGLVHITDLDNDYFRYDSQKHRLVGDRTGKVYRLGDKLTVRVVRVDLDERKIDFILEPGEHEMPKKTSPKKAPPKKRRRKGA